MPLLMTCPTPSEPIPMSTCSVLHPYIYIQVSSTCIWHGIIRSTVVSWLTFHVKCEVFPQLRAFSSHCEAVTWPTRGAETQYDATPYIRSVIQVKRGPGVSWKEGSKSSVYGTKENVLAKFSRTALFLRAIDWTFQCLSEIQPNGTFPSCYRLNFSMS